ncbi:MAG: hypothetical protein M3O03_00365 [Pseudomonadota bacterium]|nr:hypothetical protein [Pseudomonadota bacterium]
MVAFQALHVAKGDWAEAHADLEAKASRYFLAGDEAASALLQLAARIVRFYGRGF